MTKKIVSLFLIIVIALSFASCRSDKYELIEGTFVVSSGSASQDFIKLIAPDGTIYHRYNQLDNWDSEITDYDNFLGEIKGYKSVTNADGTKVGVYSLNDENNNFLCVRFADPTETAVSGEKSGPAVYVKEGVEFSYSDLSDVFDVQLHVTHNYVQPDYNSYSIIDGVDEAEWVKQLLSTHAEHSTTYKFMGAYISYRKKSIEKIIIKRNLYYSQAPKEHWFISGYFQEEYSQEEYPTKQYALDGSFLDAFNISDADMKILETRIASKE